MFSFLSIEFSLLFIAFFAIYWLVYKNIAYQNRLLITFGYTILYLMAGILPTVILFVFSLFIICIAHFIKTHIHKKIWLIVGIIAILIHLCIFKYYNFFIDGIQNNAFFGNSITATLILPLGISYYSFMAISYLVDLYRFYQKNTQPIPHLTPLQTFTHFSFFATLTAGPITRVFATKGVHDVFGGDASLYTQLHRQRPRQLTHPLLALSLILLALIKKWWLAGNLADNWVNPIFANPSQYHSLEILTAIYGYTLQLFLDFSGYSELMVGFGLLLGFRLPMNFQAPLLAHNIREFWNRWHISLSTWIRDYIYIPLGGSNTSFVKTQINLLIAMGLSGIWHGSTLNFLVWGLLHGMALVLLNCTDFLYAKYRNISPKNARNLSTKYKITQCLSVFLTIHFVVFCFVFFRATNFHDALVIFEALLLNHKNIVWQSNPLFLLSLMAIGWLIYALVWRYFNYIKTMLLYIPQWLCYILLCLALILVIVFAPVGIPGFIYANF